MTTPRVTVLITTFNRAALLVRAVDSVLAQDYPPELREILIVDDGSTDDTAALVAQRYGDRVRYLHKPNGGINAACMLGFEQARGEIIAQLDSDDWWYPGKLSAIVPKFDLAEDVVAVFHDLDIHDVGDEVPHSTCWNSLNVVLTEAPCDALETYLAGYPLPAWTSGSAWRRSALMKVMPFPEGLWGFNDAYCVRNIAFHGRVCAIHRSLGGYLVHTTNDYAGGRARLDTARMERALRDSELMNEAFTRRCREFGRTPSARRVMIQQLALAERHIAREQARGTGAAVRWIVREGAGLPALARFQLACNVLLPRRLAVFIKNRLIGRFISLD